MAHIEPLVQRIQFKIHWTTCLHFQTACRRVDLNIEVEEVSNYLCIFWYECYEDGVTREQINIHPFIVC